MPASPDVTVVVHLDRVRQNIADVRRRIGGVELHAVVKADAYGLGARQVARAVAPLVDGFVVFRATEAVDAGLGEFHKPVLALGPPEPDVCLAHGIRPAVWTVEQARALRAARPAVSVDTGMQRFGCPPQEVEAVLDAGDCREAFTHATGMGCVRRLVQLLGGRGLRLHAAASKLIDEPEARLDFVRPGLALYQGAATVQARLVEVHEGRGPAGYTGFVAPRHGVILAGYSNGLRPGPCMVGGANRKIVEVGMQSAFVELGPGDRAGDVVTLLGESQVGDGGCVEEQAVAATWGCTPHEAMFHLVQSGLRRYVG